MKKIFVVAMVTFMGVLAFNTTKEGLATNTSGIDRSGLVVESYIRTWPIGSTTKDMDKGQYWTADDIKGEYLTDLIIAFAQIKDGSSIYIENLEPQPSSTDPNVMISPFTELWDEVRTLKDQYPHLRIHISIGGWGAEGFSDMANDPAVRADFVKNVINWVTQYDLDGVDIDWEYPVGPDWGLPIKTRPEDRDNYLMLLHDLRSALDTLGCKTGKTYTLSVAVPASVWFPQKIDVAAVASVVDSLKLMSYDYYGSWSATTGHISNLYNNPSDPNGWSTDQAVNAYLQAGVPANKLVLGVSFYGRGWKGVSDGGNHGLFQKYTEAIYPDGISYTDIKKLLYSDEGYVRYWDDAAKAPFLYNGDIFISYTDEESLGELTEYIRAKGLHGVFAWEYCHDIHADLFKVLAEELQK